MPVLLEYSGPTNLYTDLCITAEPGKVAQKADECITQINLQKVTEESYQRLKSEVPMKVMMAEVLEATCQELTAR